MQWYWSLLAAGAVVTVAVVQDLIVGVQGRLARPDMCHFHR
jgi:hypothetical protein